MEEKEQYDEKICGPSCDASATYSTVTTLFDDLLGNSSSYNHAVRPLVNQTQVMKVGVSFDIIAIVEIDALQQKFIINGFCGFYWMDEILTWNLADYGNTFLIHPYPSQIWRPRLVLANTLEDRDLFEDDYSPVIALYNGSITWLPGSLFPTSCKLDLYKYPFDEQTCTIDMYSMGLTATEIEFTAAQSSVGTSFYVSSGEWKIQSTGITASAIPGSFAYFRITFVLRRLPGFFIINIVSPIVLMSFLNILVFLIPVDSGEKISYGITVLLALTVFMSIVSSELPRTSDTLPLVTIYLLVLTIISVCTVIVAVTIVYFHHRDEKETKRQKAASNFKGVFNKIKLMNRTTSSFTRVKPDNAPTDADSATDRPVIVVTSVDSNSNSLRSDNTTTDKTESVLNVMNRLKMKHSSDNSKKSNFNGGSKNNHGADVDNGDGGGLSVNRWRQIGKHMDFVSFVVFTAIWVSVTLGFLVAIAS